MAEAPDLSLPQRHEPWADLKAAYRFLANPHVTPEGIQHTHRQQVRADCASRAVVLALQDGSELDYTFHRSVEGLGFVGGGIGRGLLQHSTLAVTTAGELLGVLHQIWWKRTRTRKGETRRQRQARPTEAGLWSDSIRAVGQLGSSTRVIHVMDRGGDNYQTIQAALTENVGFLIRAQHDRLLNNSRERLWAFMSRQEIAGIREIHVPAEPARGKQPARAARNARLAVRYASVTIAPPVNDPRCTAPLSLQAVYAVELDPPAGCEPVEWMLLTSEPLSDFAAANRCLDWYTYRWVIEEWHKAEKTGCRLEASQIKTAEGLKRLAALTAIVAVRLLQLRDAAHEVLEKPPAAADNQKNTPEMLRKLADPMWIRVVSHLAKCRTEELTPAVFWRTIAKKGGFIGRKSDGMPGWQAIWRGWARVSMIVTDLEIYQSILRGETCG